MPWQVAWEWPSERMSVGEARLAGAWEALLLEARWVVFFVGISLVHVRI